MNHKSTATPVMKETMCPYCHSTLSIPAQATSTICQYCNRQININESPNSHQEKKKVQFEKRKLFCYKCGEELVVDKKAQAVMCKHCYHRNDLSDHKIKRMFGTVLQTHGQLFLLKKGVIETSKIEVGNAIIRGRVSGDITAYGPVEILKNGEVFGNIACSRLIVKKGGTFQGNVTILDSDNHHIKANIEFNK